MHFLTYLLSFEFIHLCVEKIEKQINNKIDIFPAESDHSSEYLSMFREKSNFIQNNETGLRLSKFSINYVQSYLHFCIHSVQA